MSAIGSSGIDIEIDSAEMKKVLRKVKKIPKGTETALKRALNRTVTGMKTDALKEITANYTVKRKDATDRIKVDKATNARLGIQLSSKGRPIRSIKFKHKPNSSPGKLGGTAAFLQVKKRSSGNIMDGVKSDKDNISKAFIAKMPNGTTGMFQRTGKAPSKIKLFGKGKSKYLNRSATKAGRENIEQVHSPGSVQMLDHKISRGNITRKAVERFHKNLDSAVQYLLESSR